MTEATQTAQTAQQIKEGDTVQIGDKFYDAKTVSELSWAIIKDMKTIEDKIKDYGLQVSIAKLAKAKLIDELYKEVPKMTEVPAPVPAANDAKA
jgi:hypothetical protein